MATAAIHFAELGANVTIAGRNAKEAETVIEEMRSIAPKRDTAEFEFVSFDASLVSNSIDFSHKMSEKYAKKGGLYALVMAQGGLANGGPRKETSEGHELYTILVMKLIACRCLAVGVLSRYILAIKLTDVVKQGGGTIVSIKGAGQFSSLDADDLELKKLTHISFYGTSPTQLELQHSSLRSY